MHRIALVLAATAALAAPAPSPVQDAARGGPPAFVPLESPAAAERLAAAAALAAEGKAAEAVEAYQSVADGPLALRLAAHPEERETLEQARERAHREVSLDAALVAAHRARFGETAESLLRTALDSGDARALRSVGLRFPLTDAGARAAVLVARDAHRRGDAGACLGALERLRDLHRGRTPPAVPAADFVALEASAAALLGDGEGLAAAEAAAAALGADARTAAGAPLADHLRACRDSVPPPSIGPRGPRALRWAWRPAEEEAAEPADAPSVLPVNQSDLPARADRAIAVAGDRVYWTDRFRVTALDLDTGRVAARSADVSGGAPPAVPGREVLGEAFGAAADGRGVVAALDLERPGADGRRAGCLALFDPGLRLLARRGGDGDLEHPELRGRYLFHGPPLLDGDRVYAAATEVASGDSVGDVRTHVLAFRRDGLEPVWDTFVAYGSGPLASDVAPPGPLLLRRGRIYFSTHTGLHACLDAAGGAILWARRYPTPEMAPTPRLGNRPDATMSPEMWHHCPPAVSGEFVALAPRDSYWIDFLRRRPLPDGRLLMDACSRPRQDASAMTTLWLVAGPPGSFFLAGQTAGPEEVPLLLRVVDPALLDGPGEERREQVDWHAALQEPALAGLPARTADAIYAITPKALYRVPYPGKDGAVERLAAVPIGTAEEPLPGPGNLVVLPDRVLSVSNGGILCFGPK